MSDGTPIQSVSRAGEMLRLIGLSADGLSIAELAEQLQLKSPTVHHLVRTLVMGGWVERATRPVRYRIGPTFLDIAQARQRIGELSQVEQTMRRLHERLPESNIVLVEQVAAQFCVKRRISHDQPGIMQRPIDQTLSSYSSASALLFLALQPAANVEQFYKQYPFEEYAGFWANERAFKDALSRIAADKFSFRLSPDGKRVAACAPLYVAGNLRFGLGVSQVFDDRKAAATGGKRMRTLLQSAAAKLNESL